MPLQPATIGYSHTDDPGEPTTGKPRLSISDTEGEILTALAAGRLILEIGTGLGVSTRALARYAERVITVDPDAWVHRDIVPAVQADFPNVHALNHRELGDTMFDLAFIDGSHDTPDVIADIEFVTPYMWGDSLIVCHDARYDNVRAALSATADDWHFIRTEHMLAYRYVA